MCISLSVPTQALFPFCQWQSSSCIYLICSGLFLVRLAEVWTKEGLEFLLNILEIRMQKHNLQWGYTHQFWPWPVLSPPLYEIAYSRDESNTEEASTIVSICLLLLFKLLFILFYTIYSQINKSVHFPREPVPLYWKLKCNH